MEYIDNLVVMEKIADLEIPSRLENINQVETLVESLRKRYAIGESKFGNIMLAVVEAVTNAIEHGNNLDPNKAVSFRAFKCQGSIKFSVRDQGPGFNPDALPDPTSPENREEPDGRGVFLMRNLADDLKFFDNGSRVDMDFHLA
jgi:serine/threonine-protein kinase RsbW